MRSAVGVSKPPEGACLAHATARGPMVLAPGTDYCTALSTVFRSCERFVGNPSRVLPRFAQQVDPDRLVEDEFAGLLAGVGQR